MEFQNVSSNKQKRSRNSISILVVDDDTTCLSIVAALLKKLKYEVVTAKHAHDALCALRIKGDAFDLVVSDVHMPDINGFQLQQAIANEFNNLPVVLMSVDTKEVVFPKGSEISGAAFFMSKPVSANDLKNLWQFACMGRRRRRSEASDIIINKKPKVIWTNALHHRFLEAIRSIGLERAVPKKILQLMNVPGLTRENVASHLQKYRVFLKRISDASHKLEIIGDNYNEGSSSSSSSISNYYSSSSSTRLCYFPDSATRFSHHEFPSKSFVDRPHNQLVPIATSLQLEPNIISIPRTDPDPEAFPNDHHIVSLDKYYYRQRLSSSDHDFVGADCQDYRPPPPPPPSSLNLVDDRNYIDFSSLYNIMAAHDQPSHPNHLHNQARENENGCENGGRYGMLLNNTPYHLSFAKELEPKDDDDLESLLAFGDYQIQSLEGII